MTNAQIIAELKRLGEIDSTTATALTSGTETSIEYSPLDTMNRITLVKSMNIITGWDSVRVTFDFANRMMKVYHIAKVRSTVPSQGSTASGVKYYDSKDTDGDGAIDTYYEYLRNSAGTVLVDAFFMDYIVAMC
jgi:hypothetical protein